MFAALKRNDRWIPWCFVLFFAVIAIVNGVMVIMAVETHTGLVTDHAYEKGLSYNQVIAASDAQQKLGWQARIEFIPQGGSSGFVRVTLTDTNSTVIKPDHLEITFMRLTQEGYDFSIKMQSGQTEVRFPLAGLWEARLFATKDGQSFQQSERLVIQ